MTKQAREDLIQEIRYRKNGGYWPEEYREKFDKYGHVHLMTDEQLREIARTLDKEC